MPTWCFLWRLLRCVRLEAALLERSLCVSSKYCESCKRADVSLCFLSQLKNRLCGWRIAFSHIAILSQMQLIVQPYTRPRRCVTSLPKILCYQLAPIFTQIFNRSLELCEVPSCFKCSTIIPVPKETQKLLDLMTTDLWLERLWPWNHLKDWFWLIWRPPLDPYWYSSLWNRNRAVCCHISCWHLPLTAVSFVLASLEKASPTQTWPAGRLRSHELEDTCTNADGWHEWKWFQIGDVVFGFPTWSIAHHVIHLLNAEINCIFLRSNLLI